LFSFYFIRHGQSANNLLWDQTGSNVGRSEDAELTERGRAQAQLVAQFLSRAESGARVGHNAANSHDPHNRAGFGLTHLYSSLMVRAVATATAIAETTGLPLVAWEDAHETGGIYREDPATGECAGLPGKSRAFFEAHYPRLILPDAMNASGWWSRPQEPQEHKPLRAQRFLQELLQRHGGTSDRVAVVSHGAFYNYLMMAFLRLPSRDHVWFMLNNTAITRIDFFDRDDGGHADRAALVYMNRTDFLPADLIT
jgi:2,3-bisphosphoglycerate-dependent phosphoglycerate mutase